MVKELLDGSDLFKKDPELDNFNEELSDFEDDAADIGDGKNEDEGDGFDGVDVDVQIAHGNSN